MSAQTIDITTFEASVADCGPTKEIAIRLPGMDHCEFLVVESNLADLIVKKLEAAVRSPDLYAGVVPICGQDLVAMACDDHVSVDSVLGTTTLENIPQAWQNPLAGALNAASALTAVECIAKSA